MAIKKWKANVSVLFGGSSHIVNVKANTERKARIFAMEKAIKLYGGSIYSNHIKFIEEET